MDEKDPDDERDARIFEEMVTDQPAPGATFETVPGFEVWAERQRQIAMGYDAAHDDEHGLEHLLRHGYAYAMRGEILKAAAMMIAAKQWLNRNGGLPRG